jgi:lipopolysaccharide export system permease protein
MLSRQFLASYLTLYATILIVTILVIVALEMMLEFDNVTAQGQGVWGAVNYFLLRVPAYYLPYLVPVTSFSAAFFAAGIPARTHEVLAMKAGGISIQRATLPLLAAGALLSGVMLLLNETVVLDAAKRFSRFASGTETDVFQSGGSFWYHRGDLLYNVREADGAARMLQGVRVYERDRDGRLVRSIEARRAHISEDNRWHLDDARIRTFDPGDPSAAPQTSDLAETVVEFGGRRDLALLSADPGSLSLVQLSAYTRALTGQGRDATRYRAVLQERLAEPASVLLFTLLGIPIGLAVERSRSLAVAALQGIALIGVFYGLQTVLGVFANGGVEAAIPGPWILLALFGGFGAWRFARVPA